MAKLFISGKFHLMSSSHEVDSSLLYIITVAAVLVRENSTNAHISHQSLLSAKACHVPDHSIRIIEYHKKIPKPSIFTETRTRWFLDVTADPAMSSAENKQKQICSLTVHPPGLVSELTERNKVLKYSLITSDEIRKLKKAA